jgi:hypothetical protein
MPYPHAGPSVPADQTLDDEVGDAFLDALVAHLPEFLPKFRELVRAADDDPGDVVILLELADFVGEHLATSEERPTALERALGLIETLIDCSEDPDDTADLVGMAFFDSFSPVDRERLTPWLGPRSLLALEALDTSWE